MADTDYYMYSPIARASCFGDVPRFRSADNPAFRKRPLAGPSRSPMAGPQELGSRRAGGADLSSANHAVTPTPLQGRFLRSYQFDNPWIAAAGKQGWQRAVRRNQAALMAEG